jgi:hypothetical protein
LATDVLSGLLFAGGAALAVWSFTHFATRRPSDFRVVAAHVVVAFCVLHTARPVIRLVAAHIPQPFAMIVSLAAIAVPAVTYLLLSWLWLLACVRDVLPRPRGGHPVRIPSS